MKYLLLFFIIIISNNLKAQMEGYDTIPALNEVGIGEINKSEKCSDTTITCNFIASLDSIQYLTDALIYKNKLYAVGYTFYGPNERYSSIICLDLNSEHIIWSKEFRNHRSVELDNISLIEERLYISGSGGRSGPVRDSTDKVIAKPIDLNTILISISLDGTDFIYKEIEKDNARFINSKIIKHNENFYMTYSFLNSNDWRYINSSGTRIVEFDYDLNILRSKVFSQETLTRQTLISQNNKLLFLGTHTRYELPRNQLINYSFNQELKSSSNTLNSIKYEFNFGINSSSNGIEIVSIGFIEYNYRTRPIYKFNLNVISSYNLRDNKWLTKKQYLFDSDSSIYFAQDILKYHNGSFYSIIFFNNRDYYICKFNLKGIELVRHFRIMQGGEALNIKKLLFDEGYTYILILKNNHTMIFKIM